MLRDLTFTVAGLKFAAQEWGEADGLPVLALHGWLDNSASFYALAPRLQGLRIIAIDMAGHGQSDHRPGTAPYNIWEDVAEIFAIADFLGWQKFALLGHSRGAIISVLAAGTFPERITHVALIEGLLPEVARAEDAPQQLAMAIEGVRIQVAKPRSTYQDISRAIIARQHGMFPLSRAAATALTERGVTPVADGFQWSTDPRLFVPSAVKFTRAHMAAFIARIAAPIKLILARDGLPKMFPAFEREVSIYPKVNVELMSGGHHLHMEMEVELVAASLNHFLTMKK